MNPQDNQPNPQNPGAAPLEPVAAPAPPTETTFGSATVITPNTQQTPAPTNIEPAPTVSATSAETTPPLTSNSTIAPTPTVTQPQNLAASGVPFNSVPIEPVAPVAAQQPPQPAFMNTPSPVGPAQPGYGAGAYFGSDMPPSATPPSSNRKKKIALIATPILAVLFVAGGVFGLYLPNTPENVWKTGLSRTGQAVDQLVLSATEEEKLSSYGTSEISGNVTAAFDGQTATVGISSSSDKETSSSTIDASIPSEQGNVKASLDILSELAEGKTYPDIYFKFTGIKDVSLLSMFPESQALFGYDGRWISVDNQYLESLAKQAGDMSLGIGLDPATEDITAGDVSSFTRSMVAVTNEYVFTGDTEKAVIIQKEFVGKEKLDDVGTHHYKATFNKENVTKYCKAVNEAAYDSQLVKKFFKSSGDEDITKSKADAIQSCDDAAKEFDDKQVFDIWIESGRKVIHKVRVYETEYKYDETNYEAAPTKEYSKTKYYEFGQTQTDDKTLTLFLEYFDTERKDATNRTEASLNLESNIVKASGKYADKKSNYDVSFTLTVKPSEKAVEIKKPTDAVSIQDVLNALGMGDIGATLSQPQNTNSVDDDADRKNDLKNIQQKLETYFNDNGSYPDFLDALGLSTEELTDSSGQYYSYVATGQSYTLSVKLENAADPDAENGIYTLKSIEQF